MPEFSPTLARTLVETTGTSVRAINVFRFVITGFIVVLITIASTGWLWVGSHQSPAQAFASRVVLDAVRGRRSDWRQGGMEPSRLKQRRTCALMRIN